MSQVTVLHPVISNSQNRTLYLITPWNDWCWSRLLACYWPNKVLQDRQSKVLSFVFVRLLFSRYGNLHGGRKRLTSRLSATFDSFLLAGQEGERCDCLNRHIKGSHYTILANVMPDDAVGEISSDLYRLSGCDILNLTFCRLDFHQLLIKIS